MTVFLPTLVAAFGLLPTPPSTSKGAKARTPTKGECTDFSGTWIGRCTGPLGVEGPDQATVQQFECHTILLNGDPMSIGGAKRMGLDQPRANFVSDATLYTDWNASLNALQHRVTFYGRILEQNSFLRMTGAGEMKIVNGQLITSEIAEQEWETDGRTTTSTLTRECTYDKAP